jgi:hypothetical protein
MCRQIKELKRMIDGGKPETETKPVNYQKAGGRHTRK